MLQLRALPAAPRCAGFLSHCGCLRRLRYFTLARSLLCGLCASAYVRPFTRRSLLLTQPVALVMQARNVNGMELREGDGNGGEDGNREGDKMNVVWIVDSAKLPFYRAEVPLVARPAS